MYKENNEEVPIYERLAPGECLVISKDKNGILVVCNKYGKIEMSKVPYPKEG